MAGVLGAVGGLVGSVAGGVVGVAGGVVSVAGGVVGGVAGGVKSVALYAVGASPKEAGEDEPTIYEQRVRVDQVLHFFECEYDRYAAFVQDADRLESLRVEYYNCVSAIDFQNEILAQLVDELLELRGCLRSAEPVDRKDVCIRLAHTKLDIGDRKTKRFFKEKDRRALLETLSPLIAEAKMQRLLEEQASERQETEIQSTGFSAADSEVRGSEMQAHQTSVTARKRYKHYSDQELASLLREKDD
mmetsp:Transcript_50234/g.160851  ORF Transcript_50234/g.160851 Transcript_50234/m.160851 type:complete len:245 (+) Transcript_50234:250-984(+)